MHLHANTKIISDISQTPVINAIKILERDISNVFYPSDYNENKIFLKTNPNIESESFVIEINENASIYASDNLGFVYGLLYISEQFLGIKPFWFWMDQEIVKTYTIEAKSGTYSAPKPIVKFRGWFINDEVLIMKWNIDGDSTKPWSMAFESLLRCGGNMVIPGTDKNSKKYRKMASDMGLWITHHHAEPLGAEMFLRAYPDKLPNYGEYPELFIKLWEDGIKEQKDMNVIWALGFRGQGDCPFWSSDNSGKYNTAQKRGKLISDIIELQKQLVLKYIDNPVFCTNLYGEIMELYDEGCISISEDIIKICADNGYGKMAARRRDNHDVRISSMPKFPLKHGGIYYHVSFYDLQAANHITMLPNSIDFVENELNQVIDKNASDYWLINCSNIRPHVYYLDAIRKKWFGESISDKKHSIEFVNDYYSNNLSIAPCLEKYHNAMVQYGPNEDDFAGEQFYNENIRTIVNQFIRNKSESSPKLHWFTGNIPLSKQVEKFYSVCRQSESAMDMYYQTCLHTSKQLNKNTKQLFDATILLQAKIHYYCLNGVLTFCKAYKEAENNDMLNSFMDFGKSAEMFDKANQAMKDSEYGVWKGFYFNECFADIKHTAYMVRKIMGIIRELGDNSRHDLWYRMAVYAPEDRKIMTLLVNDNHMTDWEIFEALKQCKYDL